MITSILPEVEAQGGFWDLTNNSTIYAYCGNGIRPPMSYPSAFYVASLPLAEKMRKQVEKSNPSLVLIKGKNIRFYEGNLALRSYPLYAYLMRNYRVFSDIYGKIWMIRRGCENLLAKSNLVKQDSLDDQKLLSDALDYRTIDGYPISWGKSMKTLREKLTSPESLKIHKANDKLFVLQAPAADGDFLYLKFNRPVYSQRMSVSWAKPFNSWERFSMIFWCKSDELLVPLYASTNWYMKNIRSNLLVEHKDTEKEPLQLLEAVMYKRIEK